MTDRPKCQICGEPMPEGEEMFFYHGYSGPCPKSPLTPADNKGPEDVTLKSPQLSAAAPSSSPTPTLEERKAKAFDWLLRKPNLTVLCANDKYEAVDRHIGGGSTSLAFGATPLDAVEAAMRLNSQKEQ